MTPAQELSLADVLRAHKEEYRKAHKDAPFYRKISAKMVLRGHSFSPEQCQYKIDMFACDFKSYVRAGKRSGGGKQPDWLLYEPLRPIFEDMVTVEPQQTYAVGSANVATRNSAITSDMQPQRGRERPSPPTRNEEKKEMLRMIMYNREKMMEKLEKMAETLRSKRDPNNN